MKMVKLPKTIQPLPVYLSENGYYTTNNAKEDYNFIKEGKVWDESSKNASYKNRAEGQPFFHVQNALIFQFSIVSNFPNVQSFLLFFQNDLFIVFMTFN